MSATSKKLDTPSSSRGQQRQQRQSEETVSGDIQAKRRANKKVEGSYLVGVRRLSQVDPVLRQFVPDQNFELQFGISHKVVAVREPQVMVPRTGGLVFLPVWTTPGSTPGLQGEIITRYFLPVCLFEHLHGREQPVPVVLNPDSDRVQVQLPDLFADFQIIVAVVQEGLDVLGQVKLGQPLEDEARPLAHVERTNGSALIAHRRLR